MFCYGKSLRNRQSPIRDIAHEPKSSMKYFIGLMRAMNWANLISQITDIMVVKHFSSCSLLQKRRPKRKRNWWTYHIEFLLYFSTRSGSKFARFYVLLNGVDGTRNIISKIKFENEISNKNAKIQHNAGIVIEYFSRIISFRNILYSRSFC